MSLLRLRDARLEWAFIWFGLIAAFAVLPHRLGYDGVTRFTDIENLLHHGTVSDSRFSLVMPLVSSPFLLLGEVVKSPAWWADRFNVIVVAVAIVVTARLLRGRESSELFRRTLLVLLFASYLMNRLWDYNAEVFTAAAFAVGLVAISTGKARRWGWWSIVVGAANTPAAIVAVAVLAGREALMTRRLRVLWPIAATAAIVCCESWIRRGSPFDTGYGNNHGFRNVLPYSGRPGFSYPLLFGVLSILFSFGRGLMFFMPGLLLSFDRGSRRVLRARGREFLLVSLLVTGALVVGYAKWWAWDGGTATGPRFFLFASLPASMLLAGRLAVRRTSPVGDLVTLGVLTLSAWVAVVGALAGPRPEDLCFERRFAYQPLCVYTPDLSPLGHPLVALPEFAIRPVAIAALCAAVFCYLAWPLAWRLARAVEFRPLLHGWRV